MTSALKLDTTTSPLASAKIARHLTNAFVDPDIMERIVIYQRVMRNKNIKEPVIIYHPGEGSGVEYLGGITCFSGETGSGSVVSKILLEKVAWTEFFP